MPNFIELFQAFMQAISNADPVTKTLLVTDALILFFLIRAERHFGHLQKAHSRYESQLKKNTRALHAYWDASCIWKNSSVFFKHICDQIDGRKPGAQSPLYIYRGYDQGEEEKNEALQETIIEAMVQEKVLDFHRIAVVTNEASIRITVRWMCAFARKPELIPRCHFYIAFRRKFNLGSYVALGDDDCFIAMPRKDHDPAIGGPSRTHNGVYVQDRDMAEIIQHYIHRLEDLAGEGHVVACPLKRNLSEEAQKSALQRTITLHFKNFSNFKPM